MPKFVVGLDMEEFEILRIYFEDLDRNVSTVEDSIIYGVISQLVADFDDKEPEFYYE